MRSRFLVSLLTPLAFSAACALGACISGQASNSTLSAGAGGAVGGAGGMGGTGGTSGSGYGGGTLDAGSMPVCTLYNGTDPVGFCTQKQVLGSELSVAFDAKTGVAQSWDSTLLLPDMGPGSVVLHDPRDDAAFCAAVTRYAQSAKTYGDSQITIALEAAMVSLQPTLVMELTTAPPAGYAGELYLDLRTAAGGLRILDDNGLANALDAIADAYGRAIYDVYYVPLAAGDGGVTDAVLGAPISGDAGGAVAYAPADVATGALALVDLASRHAADDPTNAAAWQDAAAKVLAHLDARARDPVTHLYFAALVASADPDHDALAPAPSSGLPADALLTDVAARIALALLRAQALATAHPSALPSIASAQLEARAEALLAALDGPPQSLWDATDGGAGYYAGWVPSTSQLLTDKPTRANALLMAALHDATYMGNGPDPTRPKVLRALLTLAISKSPPANSNFMSVVENQSGYFAQVPESFAFSTPNPGDAGTDPRAMSYFSSANAVAVEGLSELWLGIPN